jgi:alkanesulfonate monooxygenase SsuD/methylene tetrahydromethanopterin reductase-like flavin-dependent oxidoreductase (luciferase family)
MEVGIGLPNAVPGTAGKDLTEWARAAEDAGFSTLGTIDRIVYGNYEPLIALSAAAAVTERIRLATTVMLGPLRGNATLVAKQILSLDALAGGGRAVLGIAIGGREDDYEASGISMSERGAWLDAALPEIRRVWAGDGEHQAKVGPRPEGAGPSLIVGGTAAASYRRVAQFGDGWIAPGGGPDEARKSLQQLEAEWEQAGRDGEPRKMALAYYSLGPDGKANADSYLRDYYAWLGDEIAGMIADSAAKDAETVKSYISAYEEAGCDELILFPSASNPEQVGLLAEAAGL